MPLLKDKNLLMFSTQTGIDPGDQSLDAGNVAGTNEMRTIGLQRPQVTNETHQRAYDTDALGTSGVIHTSRNWEMPSFGVELVGSGVSPVTPPPWAALARACGHSAAVLADRVRFNPVSESQEVGTWDSWRDGNHYKSLNVAGSMGFSFGQGQNSQLSFDAFKGTYLDADRLATPAGVTYAAWSERPVPFNNQNLGFIRIDGRDGSCATFQLVSASFSQNNTVEQHNLGGCEIVGFGKRDPKLSLVILTEPVDQEDWSAKTLNDDEFVVSMELGTVDNNIFGFQADFAQSESAGEGEQGVFDTTPLEIICKQNVGNDEYFFWTR